MKHYFEGIGVYENYYFRYKVLFQYIGAKKMEESFLQWDVQNKEVFVSIQRLNP